MPKDSKGTILPWPKKDKDDIHAVISNRELNKKIIDAPKEDVPISSLNAVQEHVNTDHVADYIRHPHEGPKDDEKGGVPQDLPIVLKFRGENYLFNGHHRSLAAFLMGKSAVLARVVDLDEGKEDA